MLQLHNTDCFKFISNSRHGRVATEQHHDNERFVSLYIYPPSLQYQSFLDFQELHAMIFTVTSFVDTTRHKITS